MMASKNTLVSLLGLLLVLFFRPILAVRADACGKYACGSATWKWDTKSSIKDVTVSIRDTKCDGDGTYIYLKYKYGNILTGGSANVLRFADGSCKGNSPLTRTTASLDVGRTIKSIGVFVCRSDAGRDTCEDSGFLKNPKA